VSNGNIALSRILVGETSRILDAVDVVRDDIAVLSQKVDVLGGRLQVIDITAPVAPRRIRVFISSPGDVPQERKIAQEVIDVLRYDPMLQDKVSFDIIAWDKAGASTPMLATKTPQEAINEGLAKPSDCDILVVIFWSRMGTPLPHPEYQKPDGTQYLSGTEWEFWDGFYAAKDRGLPLLVVYRRIEEPTLGMDDPHFMAKYEQRQRVNNFFATFANPDGSIKQGYNPYQSPEDFRREFETHLRKLVARLVADQPKPKQPEQRQVEVTAKPVATWQGSPFPGLRAFTEKEAPIFFGRGRETDQLVKMVGQSRFVAVVGASGSGKSSLVGAGLIPRLRENAIEGSKDWYIVRCTPGEQPFVNLAQALIGSVPALAGNPTKSASRAEKLAAILQSESGNLDKTLTRALKNEPDWSQVLLFVDQFEELLTLTPEEQRQPFTDMLTQVSNKIRVVVTMRADFYHQMLSLLEEPLRDGSFTLAKPSPIALYEMIVRPAERAGFEFEAGLAERIVRDTGDEPGALALMAYLLDELYNMDDDKVLTHKEYEHLGGVPKAIGTRAENSFKALPGEESDNEQTLWRVFRELVEVDERGTATRRRISFQPEKEEDAVRKLIYAFADARLLTTNQSADGATVEVAHEALLREWSRLANWILQKQDDLRLIRQFGRDAEQWKQRGQPGNLQAKYEQLVYFEAALKRLDMRRDELSDLLQKYTEPEQERLLAEIMNVKTSHQRRRDIGDRLSMIGDTRPGVGLRENSVPDMEWLLSVIGDTYLEVGLREDGVPEIEWLPVEGGGIEIENERFKVEPFYIAKYLVTYPQFQAFIATPYSYQNSVWWRGMPDDYVPQYIENQRTKSLNNPRDSISWYQAVAFSRWLSEQYRGEKLTHPSGEEFVIGANAVIRLPLEWEWQWAAQGGTKKREYPWGDWQEGYANTSEAGLSRTIGVGMYPHGAAQCGALDMSGNLYEWCLNDFSRIRTVHYLNEESKALRGGAFAYSETLAACRFRYSSNPNSQNYDRGMRLIVSHPIT
jgi:formylglycine-generating enzyme required for sulfatase activity